MTVYVVSTAALAATTPRGEWHATPCPGDQTKSLCVVVAWADEIADDAWEDATGAIALRPESFGATVPPMAVTLFAPWGVAASDTVRQALTKIKRQWPAVASALAPRR